MKKILLQNYIYAFLILIGSILIVLYIFSWYQVKMEEKLMSSYLITSKTINSSVEDINSLNQILDEAPSSYFIYISYNNSVDVLNLEKELKIVIDNYKLNDIFYYVNLTKEKENNSSYIEMIKEKLSITNLERIPAIIYVNDKEIIDENILDGNKGKMLTTNEFTLLLQNNGFEKVN